MNFNRLGGRRFAMAMGAGVTSTVLVWFAKITPEVYQWVILGTVAAYITGAVTEQHKAFVKPDDVKPGDSK